MTRRRAASVVVVVLMGAATFVVLDNALPWAGDWVGPVWVLGGFFVPFVAGISVGRAASGTPGTLAGALLGAVVVVLPGLVYLNTGERGYAEHDMWIFYAAFIPLAMTEGAITMPVGVAARLRGRGANA